MNETKVVEEARLPNTMGLITAAEQFVQADNIHILLSRAACSLGIQLTGGQGVSVGVSSLCSGVRWVTRRTSQRIL